MSLPEHTYFRSGVILTEIILTVDTKRKYTSFEDCIAVTAWPKFPKTSSLGTQHASYQVPRTPSPSSISWHLTRTTKTAGFLIPPETDLAQKLIWLQCADFFGLTREKGRMQSLCLYPQCVSTLGRSHRGELLFLTFSHLEF